MWEGAVGVLNRLEERQFDFPAQTWSVPLPFFTWWQIGTNMFDAFDRVNMNDVNQHETSIELKVEPIC
jgi:hypothetical protein